MYSYLCINVISIFVYMFAFIFPAILVYQVRLPGSEKKAVNNSFSHEKWELEVCNW